MTKKRRSRKDSIDARWGKEVGTWIGIIANIGRQLGHERKKIAECIDRWGQNVGHEIVTRIVRLMNLLARLENARQKLAACKAMAMATP